MKKVVVNHNGKIYEFNSGYEAYILDAGIALNVPETELIEYVSFVSELYLKDSNPTPLGHLADWVAEHWKKMKNIKKSKYDLLNDFYLVVC